MFQRVTEERSAAATGHYRRLPCTKQRMQLVVMAAVLVLARTGYGCSLGCHPANFRLNVESCGTQMSVLTTMCVGQCYQEDPTYISDDAWPKQHICNGDWFYEKKLIEGCQVTYPVATNCSCRMCNETSTECGRPEEIHRCQVF